MNMGGGEFVWAVSVNIYSLFLGELEGPGEGDKLGFLGSGLLQTVEVRVTTVAPA